MKTQAFKSFTIHCAFTAALLLGIRHPAFAASQATLGGGGNPNNPEAPLSAADLAELKTHEPFKNKSNEDIQKKINAMRKAILKAIDAIRAEDPKIADCIQKQFDANRVSIDFEDVNAKASIKTDGKPSCGEEPISIGVGRLPCADEPIYSRTNYALAVTLMHEGLHAMQDFRPPTSGIPQSLEKYAQMEVFHCREKEASEQSVRMHCSMTNVLTALEKGMPIPPETKGFAKKIAEALQNDPNLTPEQKKQRAFALLIEAKLDKAEDEATVKCRTEHWRLYGEFVHGPLSKKQLNEGLKTNGWFMTFGEYAGFGPIAYLGNGKEKTLTQVAATTERVFDLGLDQVYALEVLPGGHKAVVIGADLSTGDGVVLGYSDTDGDYLLDETSRTELFRTLDLAGGVHLARNPANGDLMALNRERNTLLRLRDTNEDLFPDYAQRAGEFTFDRDDLLYLSFSEDGLTAYATTELNPADEGSMLPWSEWAVARATSPGGEFLADGVLNAFTREPQVPAFHGLPLEGQYFLWVNGSADASVYAYQVIGNATYFLGTTVLDPEGEAVIQLGTPLEAGMVLQLHDDTSYLTSPFFMVGQPRLQISRWDERVLVEWEGFGYDLHSAPTVKGPFLGIPGAESPADFGTDTNSASFFRLKQAEGRASKALEDPCPDGRLLVRQAYSQCNQDGFWHVVEDAWYQCPPDNRVVKFRVSDTPTTQHCIAAMAPPSALGTRYQLVDSTCASPAPIGEKVVLMECRNGLWDEATYLVMQCADGSRRLSGPISSVPANPPTRCSDPPPKPADAQ